MMNYSRTIMVFFFKSFNMGPTNDQSLEIFETDDFLKRFVSPSAAIHQAMVQTLTVAEQLKKLTDGIVILDKELQRQVLENHEDLLSQATWIEKLEGVLEMMTIHLQSLLSSIERVRSRVTEPSKKLREQNMIMTHVLGTLEILRRVSRIQVVWNRLSTHLESDPNDILKTSQSIHELDQLWNEIDLSNIEILENNFQTLKSLKRDVGKKAKHQLILGLQTKKNSQISSAVEVLHNLLTLQSVTKEIFKNNCESVQQVIRENLDVHMLTQSSGSEGSKRGPGRAAIPTPGNVSSFRPRMWSSLEKIFETIYTYSVQTQTLEHALRHSCTDCLVTKSQSFSEHFPEDLKNITQLFWSSTTSYLAEQLVKSANESMFVKQALEGEYPKFLRLYMDLCKRLQSLENPDGKGFEFPVNKDVIAPFEKSYLSKSVSMVLDPVHNMFSKEGVPETEEVDLLIRTIRSELSVAMFDSNLSSIIARNITKSVRLFRMNCDQIVDRGPDATQVIGPRKAAQDRNIQIVNIAEYLKAKLQSVTSNLGNNTDAAVIVSLSLADVDALITSIITPMLACIVKAMEAILLTMHKEDYSKEEKKPETSISLYMRELQEFIARAYNTYLKPFESQEVLKKCCSESGKRCIDFFVRHVSIIRPVGVGGRAKLTADCNQFEAAIAPLLGEEPRSYRMLRSFRLMLTQSPQDIANSSVLGETVPYSLALFLLFSHAPDEMKSPHQSGVNWSIEDLSTWLDTHETERDRLGLISGALGRYCNIVRQVPGKNFDPIYGIMAQMIQKSSS